LTSLAVPCSAVVHGLGFLRAGRTAAAPLPRRLVERARTPALYVIGIAAAYWSWLRIVA
jgi:hypothetical protein